MTKRTLASILFGLVILTIAFFLGNWLIASSKKVRPKANQVVKTVFVEKVKNGLVPILLETKGNLTAKNKVELYSEYPGVLLRGTKLFRSGQPYKKGDVLLRLDADEYFASVKAQKSILYNRIASIMPDLRLDYPDAYPIWQQYLENFDINKSTPKLPEIDSEQVRFFITGNDIFTIYYQVKNTEQRLAKFTITAPYDGILTEALVTEGTLVRSGQKLGEYIDDRLFELELSVNTSFAPFIKIGDKVALRDLEGVNEWRGKITRVNAKVNQSSQTISVFVETSGEGLKEGMYLDAYISAKEEPNAISIERRLLLNEDEIYVVRDSLLSLMKVQPIFYSKKSVVVKGIPDGTQIISQPVPGAYSGMKVKIYDESKNENSSSSK